MNMCIETQGNIYVIYAFAEIIARVKAVEDPPYRPEIPKETGLEASQNNFIKLMTECWDEDPDKRPDIDKVRKELRKLNKGRLETLFID